MRSTSASGRGGLFRQKVADQDPIARRMFEEQRWDVIPGAETANESLLDPAWRAGFDRIVAANPGRRVMVVVHGGVIAEISSPRSPSRCAAVGVPRGRQRSRSAMSFWAEGRWTLRSFNDISHLGETVLTAP